MEKFAQWYFIFGIITLLIGGFRSLKNKQSIETNEMDGLMWFMFWWIYLPIFIISWGYKKIFKK